MRAVVLLALAFLVGDAMDPGKRPVGAQEIAVGAEWGDGADYADYFDDDGDFLELGTGTGRTRTTTGTTRCESSRRARKRPRARRAPPAR